MIALLESIKTAREDINFEDFFTTRESVTEDEDGIAHIDVKGALIDNAPRIYEKIGSTDYRTIRSEIEAAQDSKAIILKIDSPGGTVSGLEETSQAIADSKVPVFAYCDGMACSAAYHIAASTKEIIASSSADVGNIGTVLAWMDDSALMAAMGLSLEVITNEGADLKGTFRDSPMTAEQREFLQGEVNLMGNQFRSHVESHRNVDPEVFRAGWYQGERAQSLGLIDAIASYDYTKKTILGSIG